MRRLTPPAERPDNLERWLLTYADMITLLTAFFLMLYSMSVMSKGKFTALATSVRSGFNGVAHGRAQDRSHTDPYADPGLLPNSQHLMYAEAMQSFQRYLALRNLNEKVTFREDERGVILSLSSDKLLFQSGMAEVQTEAEPVLRRVAKILLTVPNRVQIEGHTCDLPIRTALYPSNWELSTARAGRVLRYFTETLRLPKSRFTAAGYADTRPLVPHTTERNRSRNRRVDILLLKTEPQQRAELLRRSEVERITAQPESAGNGLLRNETPDGMPLPGIGPEPPDLTRPAEPRAHP